MILLDSYGWIEYFTDGPLSVKYAQYVENADEKNTIIPAIVVYEVYKKIKKEMGEKQALEAYAQMMRTKVVPLDEGLAIAAADFSLIFGFGMADAMVYATAKRNGAVLITSDRHFKGIEGARIIE